MIRRTLCLLLALMLLLPAAFSEEAEPARRLDFNLQFSLNGNAFPVGYRLRARGYAELINRMTLQGSLTWRKDTESFDLNAALCYTDKPDIGIHFRLYGIPGRLFFTSPLLGNETILLNMYAFLEFSIKAKSILGINLPWLALLYPFCTQQSFLALWDSLNSAFGSFSKSAVVSQGQIRTLSGIWRDLLQNNNNLNQWITALSAVVSSPALIEEEFSSLPDYLLYSVSRNHPLTLSVTENEMTVDNAFGQTLFRRICHDHITESLLSLPATDNGYVPSFSFRVENDTDIRSMELSASYRKQSESAKVLPSDASDDPGETDVLSDSSGAEDEDDPGFDMDSEMEWWDDDESEKYPEHALSLVFNGHSLPCHFPADADFTLDFSLLGSLIPNYSLVFLCSTKKNGAVSIAVCKPFDPTSEPVSILRCEGTAIPAAPDFSPDYRNTGREGVYSVFSFNEIKLAEFRNKVARPLLRGLLTFVAEAPAAACQSLLDDLTDMNILDFILEQ